MDVELMIPSERTAPLIVCFDTVACGADSDRTVQIGHKEFTGIGQFKYHWLIEWMDTHEVRELIQALEFALGHMPLAGSK